MFIHRCQGLLGIDE